MQLQSTLSHFAAFVLFMLSFSMLACAAPAPVAAPGALAARGSELSSSSLVARGDVSNECHQALLDLDAKVDVHITNLENCYNTQGCDCTSIIVEIVADIEIAVGIIGQLAGTIVVKLDDIVSIIVSIIVKLATACGKWVIKLGLTLYLQIFIQLDVALCALINVLVALSASISLKIKLALVVKVQLLVTACFTGLLSLLGL
ncbi:hypothetical protein BDV93DRAFT_522193 [Ceratobasidium sp. AG-I]|nr:hypothetical protein BDV93DRAFT_522193 [Ceratobasidium sp. AG-I]